VLWPLATAAVSAWIEPGFVQAWVVRVQGWLASVADPIPMLQQAWSIVQQSWASFESVLSVDWSSGPLAPLEVAGLVAAAAGLWLAGNAVLLRRPLLTLIRRRS
jgi:hypothetical protein